MKSISDIDEMIKKANQGKPPIYQEVENEKAEALSSEGLDKTVNNLISLASKAFGIPAYMLFRKNKP